MKKRLIKETIEKIDSVIVRLRALANDDYDYEREIRDLKDLSEHLEHRFYNYTEVDDEK